MSAGSISWKPKPRVIFLKISPQSEFWEVALCYNNISMNQEVALEGPLGKECLMPVYGKKTIEGSIAFTMADVKRAPALIEAFQNGEIDILEITTGVICQRYRGIHPRSIRQEPGGVMVLNLIAEKIEYLEPKDQIAVDIKMPHIKPLPKMPQSKFMKELQELASKPGVITLPQDAELTYQTMKPEHESIKWNYFEGVTSNNSDKGKLYCKVYNEKKRICFYKNEACLPEDMVAAGLIEGNGVHVSIHEINASGLTGDMFLETSPPFLEALMLESPFDVPLDATLPKYSATVPDNDHMGDAVAYWNPKFAVPPKEKPAQKPKKKKRRGRRVLP